MSQNVQIKANTRYAFACIGLMLFSFAVFAFVSVVPAGLSGAARITVIRVSLYALLAFAVLGGIFSIRVAVLRKKAGK